MLMDADTQMITFVIPIDLVILPQWSKETMCVVSI
jgi:hypothetical protein